MNPFIGRIILMKPDVFRFKDYAPNFEPKWMIDE